MAVVFWGYGVLVVVGGLWPPTALANVQCACCGNNNTGKASRQGREARHAGKAGRQGRQARQTGKTGRQGRQAVTPGRQGRLARQAGKAGRQARQACKQAWQAREAGKAGRQGRQGSQARLGRQCRAGRFGDVPLEGVCPRYAPLYARYARVNLKQGALLVDLPGVCLGLLAPRPRGHPSLRQHSPQSLPREALHASTWMP